MNEENKALLDELKAKVADLVFTGGGTIDTNLFKASVTDYSNSTHDGMFKGLNCQMYKIGDLALLKVRAKISDNSIKINGNDTLCTLDSNFPTGTTTLYRLGEKFELKWVKTDTEVKLQLDSEPYSLITWKELDFLLIFKTTSNISDAAEGKIQQEFETGDKDEAVNSILALASLNYNQDKTPKAPILPSKAFFLGNSLLLGWGVDKEDQSLRFGRASSDSTKDYFALCKAYVESKGVTTDWSKLIAWPFEFQLVGDEAIETWKNETLAPCLKKDLELVVIQLGDNIKPDSMTKEYVSRIDTLIKFVKTKSPTARICFIGTFYNNAKRHLSIKRVALENDCDFVDIGDLFEDVRNRPVAWSTYTFADGTTAKVAGGDNHPNDRAMKIIADRIINTLFVGNGCFVTRMEPCDNVDPKGVFSYAVRNGVCEIVMDSVDLTAGIVAKTRTDIVKAKTLPRPLIRNGNKSINVVLINGQTYKNGTLFLDNQGIQLYSLEAIEGSINIRANFTYLVEE